MPDAMSPCVSWNSEEGAIILQIHAVSTKISLFQTHKLWVFVKFRLNEDHSKLPTLYWYKVVTGFVCEGS